MSIGYNTLVVLAGCALLGLACGTVGAFALLRGRALMADAVGHAALPGVVLAAMIVATFGGNPRALPPLLAGALVAGVLGVLAVQALTRGRRIREDAAIAIVLSSFYALGVALLSDRHIRPGMEMLRGPLPPPPDLAYVVRRARKSRNPALDTLVDEIETEISRQGGLSLAV